MGEMKLEIIVEGDEHMAKKITCKHCGETFCLSCCRKKGRIIRVDDDSDEAEDLVFSQCRHCGKINLHF